MEHSMRWGIVVMAVLSALGLAACKSLPVAAPTIEPTPETPSADKWRPAWWHERPVIEGNRISICALAEDTDLLSARKKAIQLARRLIAEAEGGVKTVDDAATRTDSVRLPDGTFRAFVRMTATVK
jgi:hypothetical protein